MIMHSAELLKSLFEIAYRLKGRRAVKCYISISINSFIHYTTDCFCVAVTLLQLLLKFCTKANIPNVGVPHAIDTSSSCPQLCCAQPLCGQSARSVSVPTHPKLSIQISPSPGPYSWRSDLPERLFSTSHHKSSYALPVKLFPFSYFDITWWCTDIQSHKMTKSLCEIFIIPIAFNAVNAIYLQISKIMYL